MLWGMGVVLGWALIRILVAFHDREDRWQAESGNGWTVLFLEKVLASQNTTESKDPDTNSAISISRP